MARRRSPHAPEYPFADQPLTPEQVREQYGDLLDRFYAALLEDVGLLAQIGGEAAKLGRRKDQAKAQAIKYREAKAERVAAASR